MSGGGYRAAAFHLGAMSFLNHVRYKETPLLEKVRAISTVSGGTITGVVYALYKEQGKSFAEIFDLLMGQLRERDLVKEGLAKLRLDGKWDNQYKRHNLINALSEIYNQHFTEDAVFASFLKKESNSHLDLVVFNSTEFENGINFRFQNKGVLGNQFLQVKKEAKEEIKLADIIAASSCFPGGFEPIGFPNDFRHEDADSLNNILDSEWNKEVGLMDGGIYDNQGIDAIKLAEKRNKELYDLIIISDVSSPDMKGFSFADQASFGGLRKLNIKQFFAKINRYHRLTVMAIGIIIIAGIAIGAYAGFEENLGTGIGLATMAFGSAFMTLYFVLRNQIRRRLANLGKYAKSLVPEFYFNKLKALNLTDYRVGDYEPLILDRLNSLLLLIQDVFLKQIRRLNYATIYNNDDYMFRRISNLSKGLTEANFESNTKKFQTLPACPVEFKKPYLEFVGKDLSEIITEAASFGTNLWFTAEDQLNHKLDKLVIAGQSTMCFEIMEYLMKLISHKDFEDLQDEEQASLITLFDDVKYEWKKFVADPAHMLR